MSTNLDDADSLALLDPSGMLDQMTGLPNQLRASLNSSIQMGQRPEKLCMCGLGGSAMGADILGDHLERSSDICSTVVRDVKLPRWVDRSTLVLLVSYSGNTRETLAMYEEAKRRGSDIAAVSSGGRLTDLCQKNGDKLVMVPGGLQPRAALGYLLGAAAVIIEGAEIAPVAKELKALLPPLEKEVSRCAPGTPAQVNLAKTVARQLEGKLPYIYSSRDVRTAAKRWQTQINENSKMLCLAGELPEADHNQIVGWIDGERDQRDRAVFLRAASDQGMTAEIMKATVSIFEDFKLDPVMVDLDGTTPLENVMRGIVIGDFVSFYLAMLKGVDPLPVSSITELKKRLG